MCTGRGSNQGPLGPVSDALTTAPLHHLDISDGVYKENTSENMSSILLKLFFVKLTI